MKLSSPVACHASQAALMNRNSVSASTGVLTYFVQFSRSQGCFSGKVVKYKILKVRVTSKKSIGDEVKGLVYVSARWVRDKMNWIVERLA